MNETDMPDWRKDELARKYAPIDAYEPDEPDFEEPYEQEEDEQ